MARYNHSYFNLCGTVEEDKRWIGWFGCALSSAQLFGFAAFFFFFLYVACLDFEVVDLFRLCLSFLSIKHVKPGSQSNPA